MTDKEFCNDMDNISDVIYKHATKDFQRELRNAHRVHAEYRTAIRRWAMLTI